MSAFDIVSSAKRKRENSSGGSTESTRDALLASAHLHQVDEVRIEKHITIPDEVWEHLECLWCEFTHGAYKKIETRAFGVGTDHRTVTHCTCALHRIMQCVELNFINTRKTSFLHDFLCVHGSKNERFGRLRNRNESDDEATLVYAFLREWEVLQLMCKSYTLSADDLNKVHFGEAIKAVQKWSRTDIGGAFPVRAQELEALVCSAFPDWKDEKSTWRRLRRDVHAYQTTQIRFFVHAMHATSNASVDELDATQEALVFFMSHNDHIVTAEHRKTKRVPESVWARMHCMLMCICHVLRTCREHATRALFSHALVLDAAYACVKAHAEQRIAFEASNDLRAVLIAYGNAMIAIQEEIKNGDGVHKLKIVIRPGTPTDASDRLYFDAERGDYICAPSLDAYSTSVRTIISNVDFDTQALFMCCTDYARALRTFYAHLIEHVPTNTFGCLLGVEEKRATSNERRSFYIVYENAHNITHEKDFMFTSLVAWLRLHGAKSDAVKLHHNCRYVTSVDSTMGNESATSLSPNIGHLRYVTHALARECVRQLVNICALCETLPKSAQQALRRLQPHNFIVDRFNRIFVLLTEEFRHRAADESPDAFHWSFFEDDGERVPQRLLRGIAEVCILALYDEQTLFHVRSAKKFNADRIPLMTRFNTVTSVHCIDFLRCALTYENSALELAQHPFFVHDLGVRQEASTLTLQRAPKFSTAQLQTYGMLMNASFGREFLYSTTNEMKEARAQKNDCMERFLVGDGAAAKQFSALVRAMRMSSAKTARDHLSNMLGIDLDIITPGVFPAGINARTGAISDREALEASRYPDERHDDYFCNDARNSVSTAKSDYEQYVCNYEKHAEDAHSTLVCHACMGARRTSSLFAQFHAASKSKKDEEKKRAARVAAEAAVTEIAAAAAATLEDTALFTDELYRSLHRSFTRFCSADRMIVEFLQESNPNFTNICMNLLCTHARLTHNLSRAQFIRFVELVIQRDGNWATHVESRSMILYRVFCKLRRDCAEFRDMLDASMSTPSAAVQTDDQHVETNERQEDAEEEAGNDMANGRSVLQRLMQNIARHMPALHQDSNFPLPSGLRARLVRAASIYSETQRRMTANLGAPECVKEAMARGDEYGKSAHVDVVFCLTSLFRAQQVARAMQLETFHDRPLHFFDSTQEGRGFGVNVAIWQQFFDSLREHNVFRALPGTALWPDDVRNESAVHVLGELRDSLTNLRENIDGVPENVSVANENIVCAKCTAYARSTFSNLTRDDPALADVSTAGNPREHWNNVLEKGVHCQLMSKMFMRTLGHILRYCMVNELYVPIRLHPWLLYSLLEADVSSLLTAGGYMHVAGEVSDAFRCMVRAGAVNNMLTARRADLHALDVEFSIKKLQLTERTAFVYNAKAHDEMSSGQWRFWMSCVHGFAWLPVHSLLNAVCGRGSATALVAFAEVLHGPTVREVDAEALFQCVSVNFCFGIVVREYFSRSRAGDFDSTGQVLFAKHNRVFSADVFSWQLAWMDYCRHSKNYRKRLKESPSAFVESCRGEWLAYTRFLWHWNRRIQYDADNVGVDIITRECKKKTVYISKQDFHAHVMLDSFANPSSPPWTCGEKEGGSVARYVRGLFDEIYIYGLRYCTLNGIDCGIESEMHMSLAVTLTNLMTTTAGILSAMARFLRESRAFAILCLAALDDIKKKPNIVNLRELGTQYYDASHVREQLPAFFAFITCVDRFFNLASNLFGVLQFNTYCYWRRWVLQESNVDQRRALLFACTGGRHVPAEALQSAKLECTYGAPDDKHTVGSAQLHVAQRLRDMYGDEVNVANSTMSVLDRWAASVGNLATTISCPGVNPVLADAVFGKMNRDETNEFNSGRVREMEPFARIAVRLFILKYVGTEVDAKMELHLDDTFDSVNVEFMQCRSMYEKDESVGGLWLYYTSSVVVRQLLGFDKFTLNRPPETVTCDKRMNAYLYSSYDAFARAMDFFLAQCAHGFQKM